MIDSHRVVRGKFVICLDCIEGAESKVSTVHCSQATLDKESLWILILIRELGSSLSVDLGLENRVLAASACWQKHPCGTY